MPIEGVDVSAYQGSIDWQQVQASGRLFAFAKATEGTTTLDGRFAENWAAMRNAGLLRGAYHFGHPGRDAATQAVYFHSQMGALGPGDLPPVLDLEQSDGQSAVAVLNWAQAFVQQLEALSGRTAIVYTGGFWKYQLGNPAAAWAATRPLWLAQYAAAPDCPSAWPSATFWQYSGSGTVPGVTGNCDQDRFLGDEDALRELAQAPQFAPADGRIPWSRYLVWPSAPPVSGPDVATWQVRAAALGVSVTVDGSYGPASKTACQVLQKRFGLNVDGIVGPKTWSVMFEPAAGPMVEAAQGAPVSA